MNATDFIACDGVNPTHYILIHFLSLLVNYTCFSSVNNFSSDLGAHGYCCFVALFVWFDYKPKFLSFVSCACFPETG